MQPEEFFRELHGPATSQGVHAYQSPRDTPHTPPLASCFVTSPSTNSCRLVIRDIAAGDMDGKHRPLGPKPPHRIIMPLRSQ